MIKTLRITSIVAVVLACGFLVFPFVFGIRSDPKAEEFLKSVDAAEKFGKAQSKLAAKTDTKTSPLVTQAQAFGLYLNPPKPEPKPEELRAAMKPVVVTPKFTLIGTSIFPNHPEKSLALIDEPGKGLHWVKQGGKIERLTIEQIKDGAVIINDGSKTSELIAQRPEKVGLLKKAPPPKNAVTIPQPPAVPQVVSPQSQVPQNQPPPVQVEQMSPEQEEQLDKLSRELEAVEHDLSAGKLDANTAAAKSAEIMDKYVAVVETKRTRISSEEANNLGRLGSQLQARQDGNEAKSQIPATQPKQSVSDKVDTKVQTPAQPKPVPRQRDPRRHAVKGQRKPPASAEPNKPAQP